MNNTRHRFGPMAALVTIAVVLLAASCGTPTEDSEQSPTTAPTAGDEPTSADTEDGTTEAGGSEAGGPENDAPSWLPPDRTTEAGVLTLRPGPGQITIDARPTDVAPGSTVEAYSEDGRLLSTGRFVYGVALLKGLPPGSVEVAVETESGDELRATAEVTGEAVTDPTIYDEVTLEPGYTYIPTRDGTLLSAFITLPGPVEDGPYPILVEYSGYSPSAPSSEDQFRAVMPLVGYGLVQVNVRGSGCSGGSFDTFERIQSLDGYDVIETIARQPWAANIGMFGVSYPGIMQLHVASTRPPSLSAIAPLSVAGRLDTVLYPGGLYNNGFGEQWIRQLFEAAKPAGLPWILDQLEDGDQTCIENQRYRGQNPDLLAVIQNGELFASLIDQRSAITYASNIDVPTFLAGAWQDEQTGGRFPSMINELATVDRPLRVMLYNGTHIDSISPEVLVRVLEFYNLYVAERSTELPLGARLVIESAMGLVFGESLGLPAGRYDGLSLEEARATFEAEPSIEVLFEQGTDAPNLPAPGFRVRFDQWPIPETVATPLTLAAGGRLAGGAVDEPLQFAFATDPIESQAVTTEDIDSIWTGQPEWIWERVRASNSLIFTSEPVGEDTVMVGGASADLWVSLPDGDDAGVEVTLSEIAPDGSETYIQTGWLRLALRDLADDATELVPTISADPNRFAPLQPGGPPVSARIEIPPFGHVIRTGSSIRLTIDTPGGSRPSWRFIVQSEPVDIVVHSTPDRPSRLVLPIIPGIEVPTEPPACGTLRAQPCRPG